MVMLRGRRRVPSAKFTVSRRVTLNPALAPRLSAFVLATRRELSRSDDPRKIPCLGLKGRWLSYTGSAVGRSVMETGNGHEFQE